MNTKEIAKYLDIHEKQVYLLIKTENYMWKKSEITILDIPEGLCILKNHLK